MRARRVMSNAVFAFRARFGVHQRGKFDLNLSCKFRCASALVQVCSRKSSLLLRVCKLLSVSALWTRPLKVALRKCSMQLAFCKLFCASVPVSHPGIACFLAQLGLSCYLLCRRSRSSTRVCLKACHTSSFNLQVCSHKRACTQMKGRYDTTVSHDV